MTQKEKIESAEKTKQLLELKTFLEDKIKESKKELETLENLLKIVESELIGKGFKRAELAMPTRAELTSKTPEQEIGEVESVTPIKTVTGEVLATIYEGKNVLRIVTAEDKKFDINTPPFTQFLIERVFTKMQEKDRELARTGEITTEEILSYNIVRDGNIIKEVTINNVSEERKRELKSAMRWTLEKMYEKITQ
jgi:ribosomal protein L11